MKNKETPLDVDYLLKGLEWYFFPVNSLSKKKLEMRCCMKNPRSLKVRRYTTQLIDLNEYSAYFTVLYIYDKMGDTELNEILLNSMPNIWSKQAYVKGSDGKLFLLKML